MTLITWSWNRRIQTVMTFWAKFFFSCTFLRTIESSLTFIASQSINGWYFSWCTRKWLRWNWTVVSRRTIQAHHKLFRSGIFSSWTGGFNPITAKVTRVTSYDLIEMEIEEHSNLRLHSIPWNENFPSAHLVAMVPLSELMHVWPTWQGSHWLLSLTICPSEQETQQNW